MMATEEKIPLLTVDENAPMEFDPEPTPEEQRAIEDWIDSPVE
jgi:hypothetical protein